MIETNFNKVEINNNAEYSIEEFNTIKKEVIKDMIEFIWWEGYKQRLIVEYKIAKLPYVNFTLDEFQETIKWIILDENELQLINKEISKRKKIIQWIENKIHLYTLAFEDDTSNILDADGFYIPSTNTTNKYYKWKDDNIAKACEKNNVYIKNQTKSIKDIELKTTIFHELIHSIVDWHNINYWAARLLSKHTDKYYLWAEKYTWNKAEQFARLWETRYFLKLNGIISIMNEDITQDHINRFLKLPISDKDTQKFLLHMKFLIKEFYRKNENYSDYINLINSIAFGKNNDWNNIV